ncbi:MAG: type II secretion system F family protein [Armatimonadota bacterium]|nr:type II secretion system F family protein [bacterium]MDW8320472.1 type II secretion system F family protein [Armatimonadota bacterium]
MPTYRFEAVDETTGRPVVGTLQASDEQSLQRLLHSRGFMVKRIVSAVDTPAQVSSPPQQTDRRAERAVASLHARAVFFRQLASLFRAGNNPANALSQIADQPSMPESLQAAARAMLANAHLGQPLSQALEMFPRLFAPHVVGMFRAGELGGSLDIICDEIAAHYEQEHALWRKLWIPRLLLLNGVGMLMLVLPLFPAFYYGMARGNPSLFYQRYVELLLTRSLPAFVLMAVLGWAIWWLLDLPANRRWKDAVVMRLPVFGTLNRQRALTAFLRTLHRMFAAGVPVISAWEASAPSAGNVFVREKLIEVLPVIRNGQGLDRALQATGLFDWETISLVAAGQQSGEIATMLDRAASYHEETLRERYQRASFALIRLGCLSMLLLGGAAMLWMVYTYFTGMFRFVDEFFGAP